MRYSGNIKKNLEHLGVHYNEESVVILTRQHVPIQVKFVASLGSSFNYCGPLDSSSIIDSFVCMNKIITSCNSYIEWHNSSIAFNDMRKRILNESQESQPTEAQSYIFSLMLQAEEFLRKNKNIIVISSDKGRKTVIMEREEYILKVRDHLNVNVANKNYEQINDRNHSEVQSEVELAYSNVISLINPFLQNDGSIQNPITVEAFSIPLLYGCPKIHKEGAPIRPIISSADMVGKFLSCWLLEKLELVASCFNKYNVKNSQSMIPELNNFIVEPQHKLCSLDYVSMFTNVEIAETFPIILQHYYVIAETTSVPADVFMKCLEFHTTVATFFAFQGKIYKQIRGLAMGNRLAQVLAEIRTNFAIYEALSEFDATMISFFYKYVDDILTSIHADYISLVKDKVSQTVGMDITLTEEDLNHEVEFLDCVFRRNEDSTVSSRWLKKHYSCMMILNYHSYHPTSMKINVALELINKAFEVTSPEFIELTQDLLTTILKNSSYPEHFIIDNVHIRLSLKNKIPRKIEEQPQRFVSCPFVNPMYQSIKDLSKQNKMNVKLAPKPSSNNKKRIFSKMKDARRHTSIKNAIFKIRCNDCEFTHISTTNNFDVQRSVQRLIKDRQSPCGIHIQQFPDHSINEKAKIVKTFFNEWDTKNSRDILRYIRK